PSPPTGEGTHAVWRRRHWTWGCNRVCMAPSETVGEPAPRRGALKGPDESADARVREPAVGQDQSAFAGMDSRGGGATRRWLRRRRGQQGRRLRQPVQEGELVPRAD